MRWPFLLGAAVVATGALSGEAPTAGAQSARYPFCAVYFNKSGTPMCYFATREQCMDDVSGVGGMCVENSSRPTGGAASPRRQQTAGHSRHPRRPS
jgi:hypothetical protein